MAVDVLIDWLGGGIRPEGYISAHNEFYNPAIQKYEISWFDRAHNRLLDVLVMNGVFGFAYHIVNNQKKRIITDTLWA